MNTMKAIVDVLPNQMAWSSKYIEKNVTYSIMTLEINVNSLGFADFSVILTNI